MGVIYFELAKKKFFDLIEIDPSLQQQHLRENLVSVKQLLEMSELFLKKNEILIF